MKKKPKRSTWRKLIIIILILLILVGSAGVFLKYRYKDIVKGIIKTEISNLIKPNIYTDVDFTVLRTFPYASVVFKNTRMDDPLFADSLMLDIEKIYFKFNILSLIKKDYTLKSIELSKGNLFLRTNQYGKSNYLNVFKSQPDSTGKQLSLELDKILFNEIKARYDNLQSGNSLSMKIENASAKGSFSDNDYKLSVFGDFHLDHYKSNDNIWASDDKIYADLIMQVSTGNEVFSMSHGEIKFNAVPLEIKGKVFYGDKKKMNLNLISQKLDIEKLLKDIPEKYNEHTKPYTIKGKPYLTIDVNGPYGNNYTPHIEASFGVTNAKLRHKKSGTKIEELQMEGYFTNGEKKKSETTKLILDNISGYFENQRFDGSFKLINPENPSLKLVTNAKIDIEKLKEFAGLDQFEILEGTMETNMEFLFEPDDINNFKPEDFSDGKSTGILKLTNLAFKMKDGSSVFRNMNGDISFNNKDAVINKLNGKINKKNDFSIKGYFDNLFPFIFFKDQELRIIADFSSHYLSLDELLSKDEKAKKDKGYKLNFPSNISFDFDVSVKELDFRNFHGEGLTGRAQLRNQILYLNNLNFDGMGGRIRAKGILNGQDKNIFKLTGNAYLKDVKMEQAFYQLENFNQDNLTHENISGNLTSNFEFSSKLNKELKPVSKTFKANAEIVLTNGKLTNYEPLMDLSKFVRVDNLSEVKFGRMENTIKVNNKQIIIPKMEINSNAVNIKLAGKHTFNNEIEYYLEILLSEILSRKARKNKKENVEFGRIEDDGLGRTTIFLKVFGTTDNPKFEYDTKGLKQKLQKDLKNEKIELKQVMHEELGLFRGDTTIKQKPKTEREIRREKKRKEKEKRKERIEKQEEGEFIIEWEDE
ncbi:MAG: hypothetical protein K9H84_05300 [Bacteroidales bacterium]|nr:hypothetical protein [Bacteroidales bacterium]